MSVIQVIHDDNITRHCRTNEDRRVAIVVVLYSRSSIVHDHYRDATSHTFYPCCHDVLPFTASCNSYKPLMVFGTECVGIEVMLKYFAKDKANKNN